MYLVLGYWDEDVININETHEKKFGILGIRYAGIIIFQIRI
jgi:hypothetical protein